MGSTIEELKKIATDNNKFYWEQEDAIDAIACMKSNDVQHPLAEIANKAKYSWVRERALNNLKSDC